MHTSFPTRYQVPFDGSFRIGDAETSPPDAGAPGLPGKKQLKKGLHRANDRLYDLQRVLYAHNRYALLLVFQAMDAAGKDSTIRTVMRGVNPAGCQVFSFKQPSSQELDHDFLWRSSTRLPERGRIGIFNRSYYEEVLVVRVHPQYLRGQNLPGDALPADIWEQRFRSIRDHERHLASNGTVILKFWLNVSREEQKNRFVRRLDNPEKNWKFSSRDVEERKYWGDYMACYEEALNETSCAHAPWYAIPADHKPYMRLVVAETIVSTLESLDLEYPEPSSQERDRFDEYREQLVAQG